VINASFCDRTNHEKEQDNNPARCRDGWHN